MNIARRLQKLRQKLAEKEVDAIFISQPENRYYLSGFAGSTGYLLISQQQAVLVTDFRYIEQAKQQAPDYDIFKMTGEFAEWFFNLMAGFTINRLGFEAGHITFSFYRQLTNLLNERQSSLKLIPLDGVVEALRIIKEPEELALIARAVAIGDDAFSSVSQNLRAGMTEKEIAWELEKSIREHGSQGVPFEVIVASGLNAALPHHQPADRAIKEGEPVLMDIGAKLDGYASDLTRTICLGTPEDKFRRIYDIVLGAQLTALAIIKAGMTGKEADNLARTVITEAGYADYFGHGLGHGVGLAVHEAPRLGPLSTDVLTDGMVFSIEPGIYLPGWGGVRIEDLVAVEKGKLKVLTQASKDYQLR